MWRFIDTMNDGEASVAADPAIRGIDHRQCDRGGHGRIDGVTAGRQHFYAGPCCKSVGRHDGSTAARPPSDVFTSLDSSRAQAGLGGSRLGDAKGAPSGTCAAPAECQSAEESDM